MKYIYLYIILILVGCNMHEERGEVVRLQDAQYICPDNIPDAQQYSSNAVLTTEITPIVYIHENIELDLPDFDLVENIINTKYSACNMLFTIGEPSFITIESGIVRYSTELRNNFKPGELVMLIFPEGIKFIEEGIGIIQGAADGIPTFDNPSLGTPTFFIRAERLYTDIINHELAHVYGLLHTFQGNDTLNNGANCDTGDLIKSTNTPPSDLAIVIRTCEPISKMLEQFTKEEIDNFITNPLSYSPPECMDDFEMEQCQRMRKMIEKNKLLQLPIYSITYEDL